MILPACDSVSDLLASKLFGKIDPASAADGSSRTDRVDNVLRDSGDHGKHVG